MNIQSKTYLKESFSLFAVILLVLTYNCKTVEKDTCMLSDKNSYVVTKVQKISREVYAIYALRNDTIYKIVSYYNGKRQTNSRKLKKGFCFQANIYSQFKSIEDKYNIIPPCNEVIEFHGVTISKEPEHGIYDVWLCDELNGPFICE